MTDTNGWKEGGPAVRSGDLEETREMPLPDARVTMDKKPDPGQTVELRPGLYAILVQLNGVRRYDLFKINHPYTKLGRAKAGESCIVIDDQGVSDPQCKISVERDEDGNVKDLVIEDLESRNGTWVNGKLVTKAVLKDREVIKLGETELLYIRI
jgi:hypothetical protein